jgi:hypothetical protein
MPRKRVPREIEEEVLVLSRRRCAICYGLNRDTGLKQGQIAHLDGNNSNNDLDNLAYLCLDHHDQYDGRTSQSKGLTLNEVRRYRKELHEAIDLAWKKPVSFGDVTVVDADKITGHYIRETEWESAELDVRLLPDRRVRVSGLALWGTGRQYGPNIGELDFETSLEGNRATFVDRGAGEEYRLVLEFAPGRLTATENYVIGYFGMNVSFEGRYINAGAAA